MFKFKELRSEGIEPPSLVPKTSALSVELRAHSGRTEVENYGHLKVNQGTVTQKLYQINTFSNHGTNVLIKPEEFNCLCKQGGRSHITFSHILF